MKIQNQRMKRSRMWLVFASVVLSVVLGCFAWLNGSERLAPLKSDHHAFLNPPQEQEWAVLSDAAESVPILCYHYFRPAFAPSYLLRVLGAVILNMPTLGAKEFWTLSIGEFERHLRYFRDQGIAVVTLDELAAATENGPPIPHPAVVLTFDDADVSFYRFAYPLLKKYGYRAHLFVPTAYVGQQWGSLRVCSWDQLRQMQGSGLIQVESHTHDLHWKVATPRGWEPVLWYPERLQNQDITEITAESTSRNDKSSVMPAVLGYIRPHTRPTPHPAIAGDLRTSWRVIEKEMGRGPNFLSWPYGFASAALDSLAARSGFVGTVSLFPVAWREAAPVWHLGRFSVTAKTTPIQLTQLFTTQAIQTMLAARRP